MNITKSIIDSIGDFLEQCPNLNNNSVRVDYLEIEGREDNYSVEQTGEIIIKKNVLGQEKEREVNFIIAVRLPYSVRKDNTNSNNLAKLENIAEWIRESNRSKSLPRLNEGFISKDISIIDGPSLYGISKSTNSARYELRGKLKFERRYNNEQ